MTRIYDISFQSKFILREPSSNWGEQSIIIKSDVQVLYSIIGRCCTLDFYCNTGGNCNIRCIVIASFTRTFIGKWGVFSGPIIYSTTCKIIKAPVNRKSDNGDWQFLYCIWDCDIIPDSSNIPGIFSSPKIIYG